MALTSLSLVRSASGIDSSLVSDADGQAIITQVEAAVEKYLNAKFTPVRIIEVRTGTGNSDLKLYNAPVTRLRQVIIDKTYVQPSGVSMKRDSGILQLTDDAEETYFKNSEPNMVKVDYEHAWMERDTSVNQGELSASYDSGANVLMLTTISGVAENSYVRIYGTDGHDETVKFISGTSGVNMRADRIFVSHDSGSLVELQEAPPAIERYATICSALAWVARVVGSSYTDITSYGLAELQISLGEPYTQWRETAEQLIKEREHLEASLRQRAVVL